MPDDTTDPTPRLRRDFGDLRGEALIAHLAEDSNWTALELLWRVEEAALAVRIAVRLATANDPRLSDLMLHELLTPTMEPAPVRAAIFEAVSGCWPRLSPKAVREIDAALRDIADAIPAVAARRDLFEFWLLKQPGPIADAYAMWVIKGESPVPHATTLEASLARFKANAKLRAAAAAEYRSQLAITADGSSWSRAANFIEAACAAEDDASEIVGLVADVVSTSPAMVLAGPFQPVLTQLIYKRGGPTLSGLLEGPELPVTPGIEALLALVETWPDEAERLNFFTQTLRKQTTLWPLVGPIVSAWSLERWSELLAAILALPEEDVPETLSPLFTLAPERMSAKLMEIAGRHSRPSDPALFAVVVAKALANFRRIVKDNQEAIAADPNASPVGRPVDALWWPKDGDETGLRLLTDVMASFGSAAEQVQVQALADAYDDRRATAGVVAAGMHDAVITPFVQEARARSPKVRGQFRVIAEAVRNHRPTLFGSAAGSIQAQSFDIDIAAVIAPTDPQIAFAKSDAAYEAMSEDNRDELLGLLERHGGPGQMPTIERFAAATGKQDRARRARAFAIYARVAPSGSVPLSVHEGMRVTAPEVRESAFSAVTDLRPRDLELLREIRDLARTDGNVARLAARTLDTLCDYFIDILSGGMSEQERIQLLGVLGAAARQAVVDVLLDHLGDAESDALTVHIAASAALLEAVPFVNASSAQMERLAQLIDGDGQESDPAARELLKNALHKASLGPDEAVDLLYEEVGYRPTALPSELFGPEHTTIVRQFALYKLERDRGPAGWATALTHLDNVAERLMRATYLRFGTHDKVKQRILESPREPDYGNLLTACEGSLLKPRESFLVLHRLRGEETEVPHPGIPTTQETWDMALLVFKTGAKTCLAMLNQPVTKS